MSKLDRDLKKSVALFSGESSPLRDTSVEAEMRKEIEDFDITEMIKNIREVREILAAVDAQIDEEKASYREGRISREQIENVYSVKLDLLYHLAFAFNPFTTYGKKCLADAIAVRHEYEDMAGGLTTRIDARNIEVFMPVLTRDMAEDILIGRRMAIGAIRTRRGEVPYGAGALVYYMDGGFDPESPLIRIEWLFVHKDFRGRRIADSLIAELVYQMHKNNIEAISADFTVGSSWEPVMGNIFSRWKFLFGTQMDPDTYVSPENITDISKFEQYAGMASPISDIPGERLSAILETTLRRDGYKGYLWNQVRNPGFFDQRLSCYVGKKDSPKAFMLVHKTPSNRVRVEYIGLSGDDTSSLPVLTCYLIFQVICSERTDTLIDFPIYMEEFWQIMDKLVPVQKSALMVTGVLSDTLMGADMDEDMVNAMLDAPDEEVMAMYQREYKNLV